MIVMEGKLLASERREGAAACHSEGEKKPPLKGRKRFLLVIERIRTFVRAAWLRGRGGGGPSIGGLVVESPGPLEGGNLQRNGRGGSRKKRSSV